ncbi:HAD family hydrolase [Micromonosporaceae bacterium Da 78-11]
MRRMTAILIDAGRVLIHPDDTLFQHAARTHQQSLAAGVAVRAIGRTVWEGAAAADPVAFWNSDRKVHAWARHAGLSSRAGARIWQQVHRADTDTPLWSVCEPTAVTSLAALAAAGYRIAVVSNNDGQLHHQLAAAGLTSYFTAIVDSAVLGTTKPDPAIFLHAAAAVGAHPGQCVMIGDDPHFDIHASTRAGIGSTILIDAHHDRPATWPTPACRDLGAAANLLLASKEGT